MEQLKELNELLGLLEQKLEYTRRLIAEYEETMDYASHCNLLGFAEGIEFALEEIREAVKKGKGGRADIAKRGKVTSMGNDKKPGTGKREARAKPRGKSGRRAKG
jgi:hypothetical protein